MTSPRTINLFRVLFISFGLFMGMRVGDVVGDSAWIGGICGLIFGLVVVLIDRLLKGFSLRLFSSATLGLTLGLIVSHLFLASDMLRYTDEEVRWVMGIAFYSTFGYLGTMLALRSHRDEFSLLIPYVRFGRAAFEDHPVVVDTSVLIDGRLLPLAKTGFVSSALIVPRFVLEELQGLSDSADPLKRARGRRGLDLLQEAQRRPDLHVTIHETPPEEEGEEPLTVDNQLIRVARLLNVRLLTNDANLGRIARLEGVIVLNLNELTHALAPIVATGEELDLMLVKPGRDGHQAVGYLPDGRMIVVNHARALVGTQARVVIAGTHQTGTGQMYFAELVSTSNPEGSDHSNS